MSRIDHHCGTCGVAATRALPPGSGFAIAAAIGFGSMALGLAVLVSGAGTGWALLAWLLANPCGLAIAALPAVARPPRASGTCPDRRCRFRGPIHGRPVHGFGGFVNG